MNKSDREKVFNKYGGRCAYCGCVLNKSWQADHLIPQRNGGTGDIDNMMPACASCNNYKDTMDLETFRNELQALVSRLNATVTIYKISKRFGLIEETGKDVVFYFETFKPLTNDTNT